MIINIYISYYNVILNILRIILNYFEILKAINITIILNIIIIHPPYNYFSINNHKIIHLDFFDYYDSSSNKLN